MSPGWALRRERQRKALAYEAAISGRLRGHATKKSVPNDYTESRDRLELIRQARDLNENFGLFASIIRKLSIYALGRVRYRAHTGNADLNKQIDGYIKSRSLNCDVSDRYSLPELARMALCETLVAGDVFCLFRNTEGGTAPQLIEADRVGGDIGIPVKIGEFGGVRFDPDTGRVINYDIYDRTPAGGYINRRDIPSQNMAHIIDPERYDRYRGISAFAPVLNDMRDLKEVMAACLIGVKFSEYHAGIMTGGSGIPNDPSSYFSPSSEKFSSGEPMTETKLTPGTIQHIPGDYKLDFMKSERPSGQFQSYLELLIRTISSALCLPYGFVYSLSGLGGPAARMDAAQAQRVIEHWQAVIKERFLRPVASRWILDGVANGEIQVSAGTRLTDGVWQFAPRLTIDVGRESAAGIDEIRAGLRTRADWWDEEGKDSDQEMEIIRDEALKIINDAKALSESTGLPIERCLDILDMRAPNGTPALATTPEVPGVSKNEPPEKKNEELSRIIAILEAKPAEKVEKPQHENYEEQRLKTLLAAPHFGAAPDQEDALASALDASRRLATANPETAEEWLNSQQSTSYN